MRSSRRSRSSALAILLAAAAAAAAPVAAWRASAVEPGAAAAAEEPRPSGLVEKAEVRLALLEIVVLDSRGRHVRGLPRSAFRVTEKGRELPAMGVKILGGCCGTTPAHIAAMRAMIDALPPP